MAARDDEQGAEVRIIKARAVADGAVVIHRAAHTALEQIRASVEAIRDQAREEGWNEGLRQGLTTAAAATVALREEAARIRGQAGERLVRLAVELARQVLGQELRTGPEAITALAHRALTEVSWCEQATLRVHPDDAAVLQEHHPALASAVEQTTELRLEPDPDLERGACIVESDLGEVDGSVEIRLAALEAALLQEQEGMRHVES